MKTGALLLATLAVAVSNTDAFGVGHGIHRTSALTQSRGSFSGSTPSHGSLSGTALQMSSNNEVIIEKDFRLSAIFLGGGLLLDQIPFLQVSIGPIVTLLGVLFLVQTFRLNFVCDDTTFSLQDTSNEDEVGENIVVGGENRWTYDSFVNYDFFPEGWIDEPQGPILVYFKETQTPSGKICVLYTNDCFLGYISQFVFDDFFCNRQMERGTRCKCKLGRSTVQRSRERTGPLFPCSLQHKTTSVDLGKTKLCQALNCYHLSSRACC